MPIHYIPNDAHAMAGAPAMRIQPKRPNRSAAKAGYTFSNTSAEGTFAPGTPQFLFWQCREAALAALDAWEASVGAHRRWQGDRKKIALLQDAGVELNAFYDRESVSFFHADAGGATFFSGESTDVVAHEVGHGLLDSVRPDLWGVSFLEVSAFHEAFGDCVSILTALDDKETRESLLTVVPNLRKRNFVESGIELLAAGIRALNPAHNAAEPRHAFNSFKYQLPQTLPASGGPGALINESHSFGQVFTGCFWDLIANIFNANTAKDEAALHAAGVEAGKILVAGTTNAVLSPRFLQSVGRAMVLADQTMNGAAQRENIRAAFQAHDILLGTNTMIAPAMALAGPAPKKGTLDAATSADLHARLGAAKGSRMKFEAVNVFGAKMVNALQTRAVSLSRLDSALKGVVCLAHDSVMVGDSGSRAAVMGIMPNAQDSDSEVLAFVETLLKHDRIELGKKKTSAIALKPTDTAQAPATHAVRMVDGKKVLTRIRFVCGCS